MTRLGQVNCGPCHACCRGEMIALIPEHGDVVESYERESVFINGLGEVAYLKHKKNGDCVYLDRDGCTIHARRPAICRVFDCRGFYLGKTRAERQALAKGNPSTRVIFNAGRERASTLDVDELRKVAAP